MTRDAPDAEILSLFRDWIEAHRALAKIASPSEDEYDTATTVLVRIEHRIADLPAQGAIGLSVKAYLAAHYENPPGYGEDSAGVGPFDPLMYGDTPEEFVDAHCIASVLRDAARFVREIQPLAAPIIGRRYGPAARKCLSIR